MKALCDSLAGTKWKKLTSENNDDISVESRSAVAL